MDKYEYGKNNIHNAGVGGSSPPITTISHKALSHLTYTLNKASGYARGTLELFR